jgi:hypothetical protein
MPAWLNSSRNEVLRKFSESRGNGFLQRASHPYNAEPQDCARLGIQNSIRIIYADWNVVLQRCSRSLRSAYRSSLRRKNIDPR